MKMQLRDEFDILWGWSTGGRYPYGRLLARLVLGVAAVLTVWANGSLQDWFTFHNETNHRWRTYALFAAWWPARKIESLWWKYVVRRFIAPDPHSPSFGTSDLTAAVLEWQATAGDPPNEHCDIVLDEHGFHYEDSRPLDDQL